MAELEMLQESKREGTEVSQTDLLIALPAPLGQRTFIFDRCETLAGMRSAFNAAAMQRWRSRARLPRVEPEPAIAVQSGCAPMRCAWSTIRRLRRSRARFPGLQIPQATAPFRRWPLGLGARACTVLGADIGYDCESFTAETLTLLLDPAIEGSFDLVMPLYTNEAFDDLVNKSILYPLTRTLYGHRVHNPLGNEFQMSSKLFPAVSRDAQRDSARQQGRLPWLATIAASQGLKICQVRLGTRRPSSADGIDLSDALAQLVGPLFVDMEENAAFWQRIRGSHESSNLWKYRSVRGYLQRG